MRTVIRWIWSTQLASMRQASPSCIGMFWFPSLLQVRPTPWELLLDASLILQHVGCLPWHQNLVGLGARAGVTSATNGARNSAIGRILPNVLPGGPGVITGNSATKETEVQAILLSGYYK